MKNYETLTEERLLSGAPLPPAEMKDMVRREFVREFRARLEAEPAVSGHGVITDMLRNPVWGRWGVINSSQLAYRVIAEYWPEWAHRRQGDRADAALLGAVGRVAEHVSDNAMVALVVVAGLVGLMGNLIMG